MKSIEDDPSVNWRNYQRVRFIKGFYKIRGVVEELCGQYEKRKEIAHETIDLLLETQLRSLKDLSHVLYRMPDDTRIDRKQQRLFDKVLGELWHELDKARDNIRILEVYAGEVHAGEDKVGMALGRLDKQILNTARRDLPMQMRRVRRVVNVLVPLFEQILPIYRNNPIVLRTVYFDRKSLDTLCPPSAIGYFYPIIYGSVGEGYLELIRSLLETKHRSQAQTVIQEMEAWVETHPEQQTFLEKARKAWHRG
ncbi:MAG: hypothetical protein ACE15F_05035 [bacterium]